MLIVLAVASYLVGTIFTYLCPVHAGSSGDPEDKLALGVVILLFGLVVGAGLWNIGSGFLTLFDK